MSKIINLQKKNQNLKKIDIEHVLARLRSGQLVAIPTETVYGLAADATNGQAVSRIFAAKMRPGFNPLICHVNGINMASSIGVIGEIEREIVKNFWPGPLTIVVKNQKTTPIHSLVTAGLDTVAIRHPKGIAAEVIKKLDKPVAAPSANRYGKVSPTCAKHVSEEFIDDDILVIDGGSCSVGLESTIICVYKDYINLLRPGAIDICSLEQCVGLPVKTRIGTEIIAPGMMQSHYAPRANMRLNVLVPDKKEALLGFGNGNKKMRSKAAYFFNLSESGNLDEAASNLFASLKQMDATGISIIAVEPIPETSIGIAINDRLKRAAAPRIK